MSIGMKNIFWIAGENSGDLHSSIVIKRLRERGRKYNHIGIGGYRMQKEGFKAMMPFKKFSQMGFWEVIGKIPFYLKAEAQVKKMLLNIKPDLVILVDYPGFNLRIAKIAYEMDIPVLYYICPQFWAWRHSRVKKLQAYTRTVACILPFEKELLEINRAHATYVGHPIAEEISLQVDKEVFASTFGLDPQKKWIGFMPGSRDSEIVKILPAFIAAIKKFDSREYEFLISKARTVKHELFWEQFDRHSDLKFSIIDGYTYEMISFCRFITVTSGTAALEVAYLCTPSLIVYKGSKISYTIAKKLIRVDKIGLPNIILEEEVVPELIQDEVTGKNIYCTMQEYLTDESKYRGMKKELQEIRELLSEKSASNEVADLVEKYIS